MLENKKILLGVTSGAAIYKSLEICRKLIKNGAEVRVVMTKNAAKLISPSLFQAISQNPVYYEMFQSAEVWKIEHISLAQWGDLLLIAPATANIIGKCAHGIADDELSTLYLAFNKTILIAPAMNDAMFENPAVQQNIEILKKRGVRIIQPGVGELACGTVGPGRLADIETILDAVKESFKVEKSALKGKRVLISAGPTREAIDPVRFVSNPSSGKMGYAIAEEMEKQGAEVTLVTGPSSIPPPTNIRVINVTTALEMLEAMKIVAQEQQDIIIFSAAVSDYRPKTVQPQKIKKIQKEMNLSLVKNPDIASELLKVNPKALRIGFAAETNNIIANAKDKMRKKKFDFIIANDVSSSYFGFDSDYNKITIISKTGEAKEFPPNTKRELAKIIVKQIETII